MAILLGLIFTISFSLMGFNYECEQISKSVLRLHVLANSDSEEDQNLKLAVRDKIIESSAHILDDSNDLENAEETVGKRLKFFEGIAQQVIYEHGYDYIAKAELLNMHFNTRHYENITLPAGNYDALRITIGEGKGKNWWCVMFPPMCLPAAEKSKELAQVLDEDQLEIVEGGSKYEIKFKFIEFIRGI